MNLPRMRLLDEAYSELLQLDPDTAISKNYLRRLSMSGKIPVYMVGRRRLINFDALLIYLNESTVQTPSQSKYGQIRPIKERGENYGPN